MSRQDVTVELFYSGAWNEAPVYTRDGISITRGNSTEGGSTTPAAASLTLDNRSGDYDPSNPMSPLWGLVGRNTPIRITVGTDVRFSGEVTSWKPRRTVEDVNLVTGRGDAWTLIEASSQLRRIGQGADVLRSAVTRALLTTSPLAWWPLELDLTAETSGVASGEIVSSPVGPAVRQPLQLLTDGVTGSAALVDLSNGTRIDLTVPDHTLVPATGYQLEFMSRWQAGGFTGALSVDALRMNFVSSGSGVETERVNVETDTDHEAFLFITATDSTFDRDDAVAEGDVYDGASRHFRVRVKQNGAAVDAEMWIDGVSRATVTLAGTTLTKLKTISLNFVGETGTKIPAMGQVIVYLSAAVGPGAEAATGYVGETAATRFNRLCGEEDITATIVGTAADSKPMGPQGLLTLIGHFDEIQRTDDGIVYDTRTSLGLTYRTGRDRLSQVAALDLEFPDHIAPVLDPDIDDLGTRNDVTVSSLTGSARVVLETGTMSVLAPPNGVGRTTTQIDANPEVDATALPNLANWYLAKGTVSDARYPRVVVDLVATPSIETDVESIDIGDLLTIDGLPRGTAKLIVTGYTEDIGSHTRTFEFATMPEGVYAGGVYGTDPAGIVSRYDSDDSTLNTAIDNNDTSLSVAWTLLGWTDADGDFDIHIGGERMTVTAISGASSPQTFTVARSVNGVVKSHSAGADITLADPSYYGL